MSQEVTILSFPCHSSPTLTLPCTNGIGQGSGLSVRLSLSYRVLAYLRYLLWTCNIPKDPIKLLDEPFSGIRALMIRRWFTPEVVYYNGEPPTLFDANSLREKPLTPPSTSVSVNLGDPNAFDEEIDFVRSTLGLAPLPPPNPATSLPPRPLVGASAPIEALSPPCPHDLVLSLEQGDSISAFWRMVTSSELSPGVAVVHVTLDDKVPLSTHHCNRSYRYCVSCFEPKHNTI